MGTNIRRSALVQVAVLNAAGFFAVILAFLKSFFQEQRLNLFPAAEGRKFFFGRGTKFLMAFQKTFQGRKLNKS